MGRLSGVRVSIRFGNSNNGTNCGLAARNLNNDAANAWWNNGASLFCLSLWKINQNASSVLHHRALKNAYIRVYTFW